jgi:RNA polymerase sigma-70 factor, ECF subfamily
MNANDQFEAIVREHYEPLFRFAMSLTREEADARDLTQQTFYVWATKGHQLRDITKVKTWLFTTLHRAFLNARRRQTRFSHHDLDEVMEELPALSPEFANHVDSSQMLAALAGVDEVYRAAVALFYLEDCPYKDIAAILDVPIGTVKSRIARGLAQLRELLLSDDSLASSAGKGGVTAIPPGVKRKESSGNVVTPQDNQARRADDAADDGYSEWDFSSTMFGEQPGLI